MTIPGSTSCPKARLHGLTSLTRTPDCRCCSRNRPWWHGCLVYPEMLRSLERLPAQSSPLGSGREEELDGLGNAIVSGDGLGESQYRDRARAADRADGLRFAPICIHRRSPTPALARLAMDQRRGLETVIRRLMSQLHDSFDDLVRGSTWRRSAGLARHDVRHPTGRRGAGHPLGVDAHGGVRIPGAAWGRACHLPPPLHGTASSLRAATAAGKAGLCGQSSGSPPPDKQ